MATEARKEYGKSVLVWFEKFAELVEAKSAEVERERCARVCEDMILYSGFDTAAAIRALGGE